MSDKTKLNKLSAEMTLFKTRLKVADEKAAEMKKEIIELKLNYEKIAYINKRINLFKRLFEIEERQNKLIIKIDDQLNKIMKNFKYLEAKMGEIKWKLHI